MACIQEVGSWCCGFNKALKSEYCVNALVEMAEERRKMQPLTNVRAYNIDIQEVTRTPAASSSDKRELLAAQIHQHLDRLPATAYLRELCLLWICYHEASTPIAS